MVPAFKLIYLAHPNPACSDYGVVDGAYATCWITEPVFAAADAAAREHLASLGWDVESEDEHVQVTEASCGPGADGREYYEQVQQDGLVTVFYTWPVGAPDDTE